QVATDLPLALRQFANADPLFPNYSTVNQLLGDEKFRKVVELGVHSGWGLRNVMWALRYQAETAPAPAAPTGLPGGRARVTSRTTPAEP
ncbi:MAG TPA: hypothetical protein VF743_05945, partial [Acidimicrobiales bacterium]